MKERIRKAVESQDTASLRALLIESISVHAGRPETLIEISEIISTVPALFDTDDGKSYPSADEMTPRSLDALGEDLKINFSLPKYRLFTEVCARIARDPDFSLRESSREEEVINGAGASNADNPYASQSRGKSLRILGFILMAAGLATSIVGLCVPVRFMIGLGIGVIMLGSAVAYTTVTR